MDQHGVFQRGHTLVGLRPVSQRPGYKRQIATLADPHHHSERRGWKRETRIRKMTMIVMQWSNLKWVCIYFFLKIASPLNVVQDS
jgi:hypothetical protein